MANIVDQLKSGDRVGRTFTISVSCGEAFILCHLCQRRSFDPQDIANLYCGQCHVFHFTPLDIVLARMQALP